MIRTRCRCARTAMATTIMATTTRISMGMGRRTRQVMAPATPRGIGTVVAAAIRTGISSCTMTGTTMGMPTNASILGIMDIMDIMDITAITARTRITKVVDMDTGMDMDTD
mmetsp:Transcript_7623/g.28749  ORF Transcript_7623/g.28749 Transcript_7623/m.28749 type:complete len:111 (-) Transcript_7623:1113-1445(-)